MKRLIGLVLAAALLAGCTQNHRAYSYYSPTTRPAYPEAKRVDVLDDYHGTKVADPYRWLEDADGDETNAFVARQNKLVRWFVDGAQRERLKGRLTELANYARFSPPRKEGEYYFFSKNDGLQNQPVYYATRSLNEKARVLLDPNTMSKDGTVAVSGAEYTMDGKLMAYGIASGGSDQKEIRVRDVAAGKDLDDVLKYCKFASIAWKSDNSGFWYNRYPTPGSVPREDQARYNKLYWHALSSPQQSDRVVYEPPDKEWSASPSVSDDGEYLLLHLSRGSTPKNRLYFSKADDAAVKAPQFTRLFDKEDAQYSFIEHDGPTFYILTDLDAPRKKLVAVNVNHPEQANWKTIIPESRDTISFVQCVDGKFVVGYLRDARYIMKIFDMRGKLIREIELPGIGSVSQPTGKRQDREMFFSFTSFVSPPTVYRYRFEDNKLSVWRRPEVKFDPSQYQTSQVFVKSGDGTKVPMFITHRKGLKLDGTNPTLLSGYGGFNVSLTPQFSASRMLWLENGGVWCVANLRGGGEYGEAWHQAGMLQNKQRVFDDFAACAQWLIDNRYTNPKRLGIEGRSNGGLLVAAALTQRPELFGAVLCYVPLTDMLRYQRFSVARFWVPEYGNAETDASQFAYLSKYSPLQNVKPGSEYPPTMVFTAEGDDRVVPLHARKFVAALQAAQSGNNPILLRTETRAGHGGGKPLSKQLDEAADEYAFLWRVFGMQATR